MHFGMHRGTTEKRTPVSQCFKVTFVEQLKATRLSECEDKCYHKTDAEINIRKMVSSHDK